jgi:hypothetical protein
MSANSCQQNPASTLAIYSCTAVITCWLLLTHGGFISVEMPGSVPARWLLDGKHAAQQRQQEAEHGAALVCHILEAHFHQILRDWDHAVQGGELEVSSVARLETCHLQIVLRLRCLSIQRMGKAISQPCWSCQDSPDAFVWVVAQEAGPVAEQLQVLQIALVNEKCTIAQQTAPQAEEIWWQHLQVRKWHRAGIGCLRTSGVWFIPQLKGVRLIRRFVACRCGVIGLQLQPSSLNPLTTLPHL